MWGSDVSLGLKLGQISIKWDKYGILKVFSTLRFAKNTYFIQKHVFYAKTHILCKKTYFMQKHIFMSKHIFYAKKHILCKNTYFMQKHIGVLLHFYFFKTSVFKNIYIFFCIEQGPLLLTWTCIFFPKNILLLLNLSVVFCKAENLNDDTIFQSKTLI